MLVAGPMRWPLSGAVRWRMCPRPPSSSGAGRFSFGQEPRPPSQEPPRQPTGPRPSGSQPPGAACRGRCCRRAKPRQRAPSQQGDWRASARTAAPRPLPGHRGHRAPPGCGCGRAPVPARRPTRNAGRPGSQTAAPPPCGGECRSRQAWSPPNMTGRRPTPPAVDATPPAPLLEEGRRTRRRAQWSRGR